VYDFVTVSAGVDESVTFTVKVKVPALVGVPEMVEPPHPATVVVDLPIGGGESARRWA
jgi:hypothetical protein